MSRGRTTRSSLTESLSEDAKKRNCTLFNKPDQPAEWGRRGVQARLEKRRMASACESTPALVHLHGVKPQLPTSPSQRAGAILARLAAINYGLRGPATAVVELSS